LQPPDWIVRAGLKILGYLLIDPGNEGRPGTVAFSFAPNRDKLRKARRRKGGDLLRTNLCCEDPATLELARVPRPSQTKNARIGRKRLARAKMSYQQEVVGIIESCVSNMLKKSPLTPGS
jgi:hypothetical protein